MGRGWQAELHYPHYREGQTRKREELPNVDSFMSALRGDCECVCDECLQGDHCDRASCAS